MPLQRRLALAFLLIFALFLLNLAIYGWSRRQRDLSFEVLRTAILRQSLTASLKQRLGDLQKEMALVSEIYAESKSGAVESTELLRFERQLAAVGHDLDDLERLSQEAASPGVREFTLQTQRLVGSWKAAFESLGVDTARSIRELSLHAEPLGQAVVQQWLPQLEDADRRRVAKARDDFYSVARLTDRVTVVIFALSTLIGGFVAYSVSRYVVSTSRSLEQRVLERTRELQDEVQERQRSEAKFRTMADTVASAIFISQGSRLRYVNSAAEALTGYSGAALLGMSFWELIHVEHRDLFRERALAHQGGESSSLRFELKIVTRGGIERWVDFTGAGTDFEGQRAALGTAFDITDRKKAEEQIEYQAYHDALTGLPNRLLFIDRLRVALARARRRAGSVCIMFLDLDHFKLINDSLGHASGDRLLQGVAERLRSCVREDDTVSRLGGDEFTILLPDVARGEDAAKIAQKTLDAVAAPLVVDGQDLLVTTSIGIALYPSDGETDDALLKNADSAMYRAKELGRNTYQLFAPALNARAVLRLSLEKGLRRALEQDEFILYYQPQVLVDGSRITGVEALIRWQHPERGLVEPADFIHLAEDSRIILPLGDWVLRTACRQARIWSEQGGPQVRIGVNLSGRQLQERNLVRSIYYALQESGLDASRLDLEITESVAMQNLEFTIGMLHGLKEMGVQISLDDFGTGHSSLSYLKRLPIHTVKIDQSFVREMTVDPYDSAIVKAVIEMAHSLGLGVVAEGVETEEQRAFLQRLRCDRMQGFLFSKPLAPAAIGEMLRRQAT
jgi:diguanylate cyclase (GGDEF)-like protein/PAS domain S-box-containing protein